MRSLLLLLAAIAQTASAAFALTPDRAFAVSPDVVISQIYGGGGNTGAPYTNDYVELFNRGSSPVSLAGWSIQYTSATGTGNFGAAANVITPLSGVLAPGQYLLVQEAAGATPSTPLPTPDVTDTTPISMSATGGKVALVSTTTPLGCNGGSTACSAAQLALIVDLVGYDGADFFEGAAAAPTLSNTTAALRLGNGCIDTDNNGGDFVAGAPNPRNGVAPTNVCGGDAAPAVNITVPSNGATGVPPNASLTVTFSEPVNVTGAWFTITCSASGAHSAVVTAGGPTTFTLDPDDDFAGGEVCTITIINGQVTDQDTADPPDSMAADFVWSFTISPPASRIHDIQGAAHISPRVGQFVSGVDGVVTALRTNGFYMQDPNPDASDATSEALFVFTASAPTVAIGDSVTVNGNVSEFRPGGSSSTNLTTTELSAPSITVQSSGNPLPTPVIIGVGGRVPPATVIEDDAAGDAEVSGAFDPANDGLDFYESLEGMRVQINNAVAVGPSSTFGEIPVLGDDAAGASVRTARGGIVVRPGDFNPERIIIDNEIISTPVVNVGDHFTTPLVGVLDYSFGNYKLQVTAPVTAVSGGLAQEATTVAANHQVAIATFNVENLSPGDPPSKFSTLANLIVENLKAPDIVAVEEIQDNSGPTNDGVVDATLTYSALIAAIQAVGGPPYQFRQIDPVDDQDGGQPGGNIRQGFLFRTDRGLSFVDRPGGTSTAATTVVAGPSGPQLSYSPGRIEPTNTAFSNSRKPLAGEFVFNGHRLFAIANHFNSKGGDQPLFGRFQPPLLSSEAQRLQQAQIVHDFVASLLALDSNAEIVVLGDINDFEFSPPLATLKGSPIILNDLIETLPANERYTYVFEGNSQTLDHTLLSPHLFGRPRVYDIVHVNAEFATQASDHDPQVMRTTVNDPPTITAGGPYTVDEGSSVLVSATATDPEGNPLTLAWDLDNNGSFETPGQSVALSAANLDGPDSLTIRVQATDNGGLSATATATVTVANVPPTAAFNAPASVFAGNAFVLSLTGASDPAAADVAAGFTYAFDCGDGSGYSTFSGFSTASCLTNDTGTRAVKGKVRDKDNGVHEYTSSVSVMVTFDSMCELTKAYSSKTDVAIDLCTKLNAAAAADARGNLRAKSGALQDYVNGVRAQSGKAFTQTEAATLILLAGRL